MLSQFHDDGHTGFVITTQERRTVGRDQSLPDAVQQFGTSRRGDDFAAVSGKY